LLSVVSVFVIFYNPPDSDCYITEASIFGASSSRGQNSCGLAEATHDPSWLALRRNFTQNIAKY
jgi:hypothetical protein